MLEPFGTLWNWKSKTWLVVQPRDTWSMGNTKNYTYCIILWSGTQQAPRVAASWKWAQANTLIKHFESWGTNKSDAYGIWGLRAVHKAIRPYREPPGYGAGGTSTHRSSYTQNNQNENGTLSVLALNRLNVAYRPWSNACRFISGNKLENSHLIE